MIVGYVTKKRDEEAFLKKNYLGRSAKSYG